MAFVLGLVLGVFVGLGLVVGFVKSENARSKRRADLAATIAAFARMTVEDSRKILPPQYYPSWVVFSQSQKLSFPSNFSLLFHFWMKFMRFAVHGGLTLDLLPHFAVDLAQSASYQDLAVC